VQWLLCCLIVGFVCVLFRRRLYLVAGLALALAVLVPYDARRLITGANVRLELDFHPFILVLFVATAVIVLGEFPLLVYAVTDRPVSTVVMVAYSAYSLVTVSLTSVSGVRLIVTNLVAPTLAYVVFRAAYAQDKRTALFLGRLVVGLAVAEAVLALFQWLTQRALLYTTQYYYTTWFAEPLRRTMGTMDHPLTLALFLAAATAALAALRRTLLLVGCGAGVVAVDRLIFGRKKKDDDSVISY